MPSQDKAEPSLSHCVNPHRLFHGVWLPQWLEERQEVSEKAKKLYAYLTYFAGGKGYAWPSFNYLTEKLHVSRRYVIKLVQELSAHRLITATRVSKPVKRPLHESLPVPLACVDADCRGWPVSHGCSGRKRAISDLRGPLLSTPP